MIGSIKNSLRLNIGAFIAILCVLVGGTWMAVKLTADHLLYQSATASASNWARYLAESVADLEQIAQGEPPSVTSLLFLRNAGRSGVVFRYEIFNRHGFSQLVSDLHTVTAVDLSEFNEQAARSVRSGKPVVDALEGQSPDMPSYFARAYVPAMVDGKPVAVVAAYVDQADQRNELYRTFLLAAASLCLLTVVSFAIPAVAWLRRTREKQQADRRIRYLAHHDALTGLINRAHLSELLEMQLALLPGAGSGLALHFLDLDRFKEVNDSLGHDAGDFLLKTLAERLRAVTRTGDIVARLGGDEFVVVQYDVRDRQMADDFAQRLMAAAIPPMTFHEQEIIPGVTIGVALAPVDGKTADRLLKSADLALYAGKNAGRNCIRFFTSDLDESMQARLRLERTIREAVINDRFDLHYQPVFEVDSQTLVGFEALLRLSAEDGTMIPPMTFIPVAEDIRLIGKIGEWVLRRACNTAATWPDQLTIAVNLSPAQFESGDMPEIVAAALKQSGLDPHRLELEITESLLLANSEPIMAQLMKLKAMGVAIVMDDFGTGYSSLSYLWQFPFDKIKIDRSFMQGLDDSGRDAATVVKSVIALGRELHMRVTVEGVETSEQQVFLERSHADLVQGYHFGRPIPATELGAFMLKAESSKTPRAPGAKLVVAN